MLTVEGCGRDDHNDVLRFSSALPHKSGSLAYRCCSRWTRCCAIFPFVPQRVQDVDEEFVIMFLVSDENQSHYLQTSIDKYGGDPQHQVRGSARQAVDTCGAGCVRGKVWISGDALYNCVRCASRRTGTETSGRRNRHGSFVHVYQS